MDDETTLLLAYSRQLCNYCIVKSRLSTSRLSSLASLILAKLRRSIYSPAKTWLNHVRRTVEETCSRKILPIISVHYNEGLEHRVPRFEIVVIISLVDHNRVFLEASDASTATDLRNHLHIGLIPIYAHFRHPHSNVHCPLCAWRNLENLWRLWSSEIRQGT